MINKQELLKTFQNKEDKIIFSKVLDQAVFCSKKHQTVFTEFLNPSNLSLFLDKLKTCDLGINIKVFGGFEDSERAMMAFYQEYLEIEESDFPISIIKIEYSLKYSRPLNHRDFLGSILGLGINRTKIGDILLDSEAAFCFVQKDIADFLTTNITKVSKTKVYAEEIGPESCNFVKNSLKEKDIIVSSERLDAVLSSAFNISRAKISAYISSEKVFINWCIQTNASKKLKVGDNVTVRGVGKIKLSQIKGATKKDKIILTIFSTK